MTLRADELFLVCREAERLLSGLPVHKVVQPDGETVLLQVRGHWLLLCASARAGRLHLIDEKPAGTGEAAPAFCMLLRKHLIGARVARISAVEGERACELELVSPVGIARLRLFLFGPAAQLQLLATDDAGEERVLGAIGPARRLYAELPAPHPRDAAVQPSRLAELAEAPAIRGETPLSRRIAELYGDVELTSSVEQARRVAAQQLAVERRRNERLIERLEADLLRGEQAESRRKEADLLLAHLHEIPRGASSVTLPDDFTDGSPLVIALDPSRSARDNAERIYKAQRRLTRARAKIEARRDEALEKLARLAAQLRQLEGSSDEAVLADARKEGASPARGPAGDRALRGLPYKAFLSQSGVPIYVGRGASKNDELTWKIARGNDLWLHTRDVPGAHVIVPLDGGRSVDESTLVDAATLAAHHSSARDEDQVDVGYALRKHLRKPKGAPAGAVLVSQEKTIRVRMEPGRLQRLLKTPG